MSIRTLSRTKHETLLRGEEEEIDPHSTPPHPVDRLETFPVCHCFPPKYQVWWASSCAFPWQMPRCPHSTAWLYLPEYPSKTRVKPFTPAHWLITCQIKARALGWNSPPSTIPITLAHCPDALLFFLFGRAHGMQKFPSQGVNLHPCSNQSHSKDSTGSLSCWTTREAPNPNTVYLYFTVPSQYSSLDFYIVLSVQVSFPHIYLKKMTPSLKWVHAPKPSRCLISLTSVSQWHF